MFLITYIYIEMSARPATANYHALNAAKMAYNWVFTCFNDEAPAFDDAQMHYMCYQQECCPETGRLHWQGYVELKNNTRRAATKALLGGGDCWLEPRGATSAAKARDYCCKEKTAVPDTFVEEGIISTERFQSARSANRPASSFAAAMGEEPAMKAISQQAAMVEAINNGASYDTITRDYAQSFLRNPNGTKELMYQVRIRSGAVDAEKDVRVWWGTTRTGKTWAVAKALEAEGLRAYWLKPTTQGKVWFSGYDGEEVIVIDDFEGQMAIEDFLHLTDRYASRHIWETKGSHAKLLHTKVFITSNTDPRTWFSRFPQVKVDAAMARMNNITRMYAFPHVNQVRRVPAMELSTPIRPIPSVPVSCPAAPIPVRKTAEFRQLMAEWEKEDVDMGRNLIGAFKEEDEGMSPLVLPLGIAFKEEDEDEDCIIID